MKRVTHKPLLPKWVTDNAGNETTATTTGEVDTAAPVVTINALGDTSDTTPTLSGTVSGEPTGSTVTLTVTDANGAVQTRWKLDS